MLCHHTFSGLTLLTQLLLREILLESLLTIAITNQGEVTTIVLTTALLYQIFSFIN